MEKKYKLALVLNGFMPLYLEYLKTICTGNSVDFDIFDENDCSNTDFNNYDYVLSDKLPLEGCVKVFHHNSVLYQLDKSRNFFYKFIYKLSRKKKIETAEKLNKSYLKYICVSNELKRDLEKYYNISPEDLIVAHAGFVPPAQNNDEKIFKSFDKDEVFTICTSAAGFVTKGGYTLLKALRIFRKLYPQVKIKAKIIYPKYKTNLAVNLYVKLFRLDEMVEFYGYQNDINSFYASSHCLTCQSVYEAFGRIVTEAMYQKIPVIVGNNIGAADIIQDNVNGFIFEDGKDASLNLARKIKEVYDKYNDLEPLVENAYQTSKNMTWENFANDVFFGLYPELKAKGIKTLSSLTF